MRHNSLWSSPKARNTSAHAEKALLPSVNNPGQRKHLRSRGESVAPFCQQSWPAETPPLTRRKPAPDKIGTYQFGNTSAHAEKTTLSLVAMLLMRKHLRSRGESMVYSLVKSFAAETPPLTRRKHWLDNDDIPVFRNTSAHAEKASVPLSKNRKRWKHLRSRGESALFPFAAPSVVETPPLTRRKHHPIVHPGQYIGNTSAHAEKAFCSVALS